MSVETSELTSVSDEDLMLGYVEGDQQSFEELYARHKDRLYRFILRSVDSEALARELFQDIWMGIIKHKTSYTPTASFSTWLYRITRNRLTDQYRRSAAQFAALGYQQTIATDDEAAPDQDVVVLSAPLGPDEIAVISERQDSIRQALETLSDSQKEAVLLRHIAGMTVSEIASATNENPETIKSRLRYAFTRLRQQLRANS